MEQCSWGEPGACNKNGVSRQAMARQQRQLHLRGLAVRRPEQNKLQQQRRAAAQHNERSTSPSQATASTPQRAGRDIQQRAPQQQSNQQGSGIKVSRQRAKWSADRLARPRRPPWPAGTGLGDAEPATNALRLLAPGPGGLDVASACEGRKGNCKRPERCTAPSQHSATQRAKCKAMSSQGDDVRNRPCATAEGSAVAQCR